MITVIDYSAGNLYSVFNALTRLGYEPKVTNKPDEVTNASMVILSGVGTAAKGIAVYKINQPEVKSLQRYYADIEYLGHC